MLKEFKKEDLRTGQVVKLRDGSFMLVLLGSKIYHSGEFTVDFYDIKDGSAMTLKDYTDDLTYNFINNDRYDVVSVYEVSLSSLIRNSMDIENIEEIRCIYERLPLRRMTIEQIEKELGYRIEIITA